MREIRRRKTNCDVKEVNKYKNKHFVCSQAPSFINKSGGALCYRFFFNLILRHLKRRHGTFNFFHIIDEFVSLGKQWDSKRGRSGETDDISLLTFLQSIQPLAILPFQYQYIQYFPWDSSSSKTTTNKKKNRNRQEIKMYSSERIFFFYQWRARIPFSFFLLWLIFFH